MNQNSDIIVLSPIFPSSFFYPKQIKTWSSSNNKSLSISPFLAKSSLMPQNKIDLNFQAKLLKNSINTNKSTGITIPASVKSSFHNLMNIQFDNFSSSEKGKTVDVLPLLFKPKKKFFSKLIPQRQEIKLKSTLYNSTPDNKKSKQSETFHKIKCPLDKLEKVSEIQINLQNSKKQNKTLNNMNNEIANDATNLYEELMGKNKQQKSLLSEYRLRERSKENLIANKRTREKRNILSPTVKKLKNSDKMMYTMNLNQIKINNVSLIKYPIISITEEELNVQIFVRLLTENNYFQCENRKNYNFMLTTNELSNETFINYFTQKLTSHKGLLLLEENEQVILPYDIIKNYYRKMKQTILTIQKNFMGKRKRILNKEQCDILYKLIVTINYISQIICSYSFLSFDNEPQIEIEDYHSEILPMRKVNSISNKRKQLKSDVKSKKNFECPFCSIKTDSDQKLEEHISRKHPNQSEKYKQKLNIRKRRIINRKILAEIKEKFLNKYNIDINKLDKREVRNFLTMHKIEYIKFKKQQQKAQKK